MGTSAGDSPGSDFHFYDLRAGTRSTDIALLFPDWRSGDERVAIFSPHDDDAILGAGYAILATHAAKGEVCLLIFSDGRLGYSTVGEREATVRRRRAETVEACAVMGIDESRIVRFDYPDASVNQLVGWFLQDGGEASFPDVLRKLRELAVTRILVPNRYREHVDHDAVGHIGLYVGPIAGDDVLPDHGSAAPIRSFHEYAVWGDFSPEDALVNGGSAAVRANRAIVTGPEAEQRVCSAIRKFASQSRVIASIVRAREKRQFDGRFMELYLALEARPTLDCAPYVRVIRRIDRQHD